MRNDRNLKALLLVGGMGTRLRSVTASVSKPLAQVGGACFLDLLVEQLRNQGFQNLVMCTGYLSKQIEVAIGIAASGKSDPLRPFSTSTSV